MQSREPYQGEPELETQDRGSYKGVGRQTDNFLIEPPFLFLSKGEVEKALLRTGLSLYSRLFAISPHPLQGFPQGPGCQELSKPALNRFHIEQMISGWTRATLVTYYHISQGCAENAFTC